MTTKKRKNLNNEEIYTFCDQMAMILHAGISPIEGISIMIEDISNKEGEQILTEIYTELEQSGSLYQALSTSNAFPTYVLDMIHLGETAGKLEEIMISLKNYYIRENEISLGIKNAITYPLIMISMLFIIIIVLITSVMPIFNQVFIQLGSEMTGFSKGILTLGINLRHYSTIIIFIVFVLLLTFIFLSQSITGKSLIHRFGSHFFLTKSVHEKIALGRFSNGLALTLSSGLDTDQSIELASKLVHNHTLNHKIAILKASISKGHRFSDAIKISEIFSGIYASMLTIGFKSGILDEVIQKIADQNSKEIDESIEQLLSILEPTLVAILSIIVGMILLSVMLPLIQIMATIG